MAARASGSSSLLQPTQADRQARIMEQQIKQRFRISLQEQIANQISLAGTAANDATVKALIASTVASAVERTGGISSIEQEELIADFTNEFLYFGPLQPLLADETISEIMVNGGGFDKDGQMLPHEVWIERNGKTERITGVHFDDEEHVRRIMNRICARQGRRIDDANPIEDATLPDGSRFNGTIYPLCPDGSSFNIRRFNQDMLTADDLVQHGTATPKEMEFLLTCVAARCSILVSGGTGSGKTTLLNVLASAIPKEERVITIEDTCELLIYKQLPDVVRFEARKANSEGKGEVTLDDHLQASLRKRPDRIIIGECRGPEAYTMLEAMNTGHDGSMSTIHANDPIAALNRLVTLAKQGDPTISEETIRAKIASALDMVVQTQRLPDGSRRIVSVEAIGDYVDGHIQHEQLFSFERERSSGSSGAHVSCRCQPARIRRKINDAGLPYKVDWFFPEQREA